MGKSVLGRNRVSLQSRVVCTVSGLAVCFGLGVCGGEAGFLGGDGCVAPGWSVCGLPLAGWAACSLAASRFACGLEVFESFLALARGLAARVSAARDLAAG